MELVNTVCVDHTVYHDHYTNDVINHYITDYIISFGGPTSIYLPKAMIVLSHKCSFVCLFLCPVIVKPTSYPSM